MRAVFALLGPHPGPLPQGEGEKRHALFGDRISNYQEPNLGAKKRPIFIYLYDVCTSHTFKQIVWFNVKRAKSTRL